MKETEIVSRAVEKLLKVAEIEATWKENATNEFDGIITFNMKDVKITLNALIKKELRKHQLNLLKELKNPIIIAERIFPNIKRELRDKNVAYLEANGNIYLKTNNFFLWLETQKPVPTKKEKGNRAFTKTGLKVLFHFLVDEELVKLTYRQIANITDVALGNVNNIFNGLKETGFLLKLNKNEFILNNKKELLQKWATAYKETLQPTLEVGRFRFADEKNFIHWRNIKLQKGKTWWGGEPAGDLQTNYLRPGELTLYTTETRNELMKNYRLIPDPEGDVVVYKKFWNDELRNENDAVPLLLTYVDLVNTRDKRCLETAEMVYKKYVEPNL